MMIEAVGGNYLATAVATTIVGAVAELSELRAGGSHCWRGLYQEIR